MGVRRSPGPRSRARVAHSDCSASRRSNLSSLSRTVYLFQSSAAKTLPSDRNQSPQIVGTALAAHGRARAWAAAAGVGARRPWRPAAAATAPGHVRRFRVRHAADELEAPGAARVDGEGKLDAIVADHAWLDAFLKQVSLAASSELERNDLRGEVVNLHHAAGQVLGCAFNHGHSLGGFAASQRGLICVKRETDQCDWLFELLALVFDDERSVTQWRVPWDIDRGLVWRFRQHPAALAAEASSRVACLAV